MGDKNAWGTKLVTMGCREVHISWQRFSCERALFADISFREQVHFGKADAIAALRYQSRCVQLEEKQKMMYCSSPNSSGKVFIHPERVDLTLP
jgi:hypothetical protein